MGAMIFGGVENEHIQFNEDTLWTGQPHDYVRAGAHESLSKIQQLVADGKTDEAQKLAKATFLSDPIRQKAYQPFGDVRIHFTGQNKPSDYRRALDLESALASVSYRAGSVNFKREVFASYPDQAIVVRLSADAPAKLSFTVDLDSAHESSTTTVSGSDTLILAGQVEVGGLRFEGRLRVIPTQGKLHTEGHRLVVENADSVVLLLTAATSFKNFEDISGDPAQRASADLAKLRKRDYASLLAAHTKDYQWLFRRVALDLGTSPAADEPTDRRVQALRTGGLIKDPALAALYFQYGRYLLIASSRPGSQPANLQGIWNDQLAPPWESKWTTNINLEMNYWPAELTNLSECHGPLFDLIDDLVISGHRTAQEQYGCRGWVLNHNTDLWRGTAPINGVDGIWPTGGAWLCHHLWEHYLFTGDKTFLSRRAYPAMKEASLFFVDFLTKDAKTGWLVSSPSFSPEQGGMCAGPTMDQQLIRSLFDHTIAAAEILHIDADFVKTLNETRAHLAPNQIGQHGQLQEWLQDIDKPDNNHRHMSPLWALYPGDEITPADPKMFAAAKVLLGWRGVGSTGWSYAWRIPLWARAGDAEFAYLQLSDLLAKRTLTNLFDLCGPFQIDGNFGATAGIVEMLLQSQQHPPENAAATLIDLLPALPKAWPTGSVTGLRARGGFEVDLAWKEGALTSVTLRSQLGLPCRLRLGTHDIDLPTKTGASYVFDGSLHRIMKP